MRGEADQTAERSGVHTIACGNRRRENLLLLLVLIIGVLMAAAVLIPAVLS